MARFKKLKDRWVIKGEICTVGQPIRYVIYTNYNDDFWKFDPERPTFISYKAENRDAKFDEMVGVIYDIG